ncbi:13314_t:CDS:2 [Ambispora gerdemannii]|uniref:13314_t:CDS:1 n=1 Tax=Ambispora gerdemannii TaxID=144530 RepID=A0A9N9FXR4_9GLOM|nr:13314_t:CDS:2 [Ambispora gerdemannii]
MGESQNSKNTAKILEPKELASKLLAIFNKGSDGFLSDVEIIFRSVQEILIPIHQTYGLFYHYGIGTEPNEEMAFTLFKKSAIRDNTTPKDINEAIKYYKKAADAGDAAVWKLRSSSKSYDGRDPAESDIVHCYERGIGVKKDGNKVFYWYSASVRCGEPNGDMHKATNWLYKAHTNKDEDSTICLRELF